jgi:8-oxo-dGTP pyrophosphatase MutT (NUDIX family)
MKDSIVYTCYRDGLVLAEQRLSNSQYAPGQIVFPGGRVDQKDASVTAAFFRELREELGIEAAGYYKGDVLSIPQENINLFPFLLLSWNGKIPNMILDKGNPVMWQDLEKMKQSERYEISALSNIFYTLVHPHRT